MHNGQPLSMELISKGSVPGNIHTVENLILSEKNAIDPRIQKSQLNSEIRHSIEFLFWNACSINRMF